MFHVFLFYVLKEVAEQLRVIHNQLVYNGSMHVYTGELVAVSVYYFGHSSKVGRNSLCVRLYYQVVVAYHVLQEVAVAHQVFEQWCEPYGLLGLLPQFELIVSQYLELLCEALDGVDDFLNEYLQN